MSGHKDYFNGEAAALLGEQIAEIWADFDVDGYRKEVEAEVEGLEIKDRVMKMALGLQKRLPDDYPTAVQILVDSLGDEIAGGEGMFTEGWYLMPVARFVEEFGQEHWQASLDALHEITRRHTGEYAVRPYIEQYPDKTLTLLKEWTTDDNFHVRRLVSEGLRPRLPWATQLKQFVDDPAPVLEILELLRDDSAEYVQKSVGNNLNDIAKDHPELVLDTTERWLAESSTDNTRSIVKRALRKLEKANNPRALAQLGFTGGEKIELVAFELDSAEIKIGDSLQFSLTIKNEDSINHRTIINYAVHLVRKSGKRNIKVFNMSTQDVAAGETVSLTKSQSFKPVKVRKYYPGTHQLDVLVNGLLKASAEFELLAG